MHLASLVLQLHNSGNNSITRENTLIVFLQSRRALTTMITLHMVIILFLGYLFLSLKFAFLFLCRLQWVLVNVITQLFKSCGTGLSLIFLWNGIHHLAMSHQDLNPCTYALDVLHTVRESIHLRWWLIIYQQLEES